MSTIKFQIRDANGIVDGPFDTIRDAVLYAAGHDGFGACFQRDEEGEMRLYSSSMHIGNNVYVPKRGDAFQAWSKLEDDDAAEADVAQQVRAKGVLHSRYHNLDIVELTFDGDALTHVDGRTPAEILAEDFCDDDEMTIDMIRSLYTGAN